MDSLASGSELKNKRVKEMYFDFQTISQPKYRRAKFLILGPPKSGRTTVVRTLLYYLSPLIRYAVVFTRTDYEYKDIIPDILIHERMDKNILKNIKEDDNEMETKRIVIIIDDINFNDEDLNILTTGFNNNIVLIVVNNKTHLEYNFIILTHIKNTYKFHLSNFPMINYEEISPVYEKITKEKHSLFIIDYISYPNMLNTRFYEYLCYYSKAILPRDYPTNLKIGLKYIWKVNEVYIISKIYHIKKKYYDIHFRYYYS